MGSLFCFMGKGNIWLKLYSNCLNQDLQDCKITVY